jgi:hypothetical protein
VLQAQAADSLAQVVIAHPQATRPHNKSHETGAIAGAADLALDRVQLQPQGCEFLLDP